MFLAEEQYNHPDGTKRLPLRRQPLAAPSAPSNADDTDDTTYVCVTTLIRVIVAVSCAKLGEATGSRDSPPAVRARSCLAVSVEGDGVGKILSGWPDNRPLQATIVVVLFRGGGRNRRERDRSRCRARRCSRIWGFVGVYRRFLRATVGY